MHRRSFIKLIGLILSIFNVRIFGYDGSNTEKISFKHGVASGDPTKNKIILWTKITKSTKKTINVNWQVSDNKNFSNLINSGSAKSYSYNDFSVKVDAKIPNKYCGSEIYYRFYVNTSFSVTGTTKTLPKKDPNNFNMAICSCSNYPGGFFNAYKEIANDNNIDMVLHLGDYLYEYDKDGYASEDSKSMNRVVEPEHEIVTLDDYRKRHALYKTDEDLQLLHSKKAMVAVWDDHEFTNDSWKYGAENHSVDEGSFSLRKANAVKAYYEWMPIRESKAKLKIWRKFEIGTLFQLFMLDTRSIYRDKQLDLDNYINDDKFEVSRFKKDLLKKRDLVGKEQFQWLNENVDNKFKWSIIGQQVLVAPTVLPEIFLKIDKSKIPEYLHKYFKIAGMNIPYNTDSWDGYPKEREKLYKILSKSQSNVVLTGDTHNSWISNLYNQNNEFIAVEIATPAISSPNTVDTFGSITKDIDDDFVKNNKHLKWANGLNKGYVKLTITRDNIKAKFLYVSTVKSKDYYLIDKNQFIVQHKRPI